MALVKILGYVPIFTLFLTAASAQTTETVPIRRNLENLSLGDSLRKVKKLLPPARVWEGRKDSYTGVVFFRLEPGSAKGFPERARMMGLGFKSNRLVFLKVIYNSKQTRAQPLGEMVGDISMDYGAPLREGSAYIWNNRKTALRAFLEGVPAGNPPPAPKDKTKGKAKGKGKASRPPQADAKPVELLNALELMNADLYPPRYQTLLE